MNFCPRRQGAKGVAGARARQLSADFHTEPYRTFLRRHEMEAVAAARGDQDTKQTFVSKLLKRTADPRNLRLAWDWIASKGGQAPGADGLRFDDLDEPEVWPFLRAVGKLIRQNTYRTVPDRMKKIPKTSGKGYRTLAIPSIVDRLVKRAIVQVIQPYLDVFLDDNCLGYRPTSDIYKALARADQLAVEGNRWVWLTEDLRDAFNHVPQRRLFDIIRKHIPNQEMMWLIERVMLTDTGGGLRQGGNLSPLLLNVYLDHFLDKKWRRQHPHIPLLRWADDLLVLGKNQEEAAMAYNDLKRLLLPAGMKLKGTPDKTIHNLLAGAYADWLGYRLTKENNGMTASLTETTWKSLGVKLEQDHDKNCSPLRANQTILGWIGHLGPCFRGTDLDQAYTRITTLAHRQAFDEIPSGEQIRRYWRSAYRRWERVRKEMELRDQS